MGRAGHDPVSPDDRLQNVHFFMQSSDITPEGVEMGVDRLPSLLAVEAKTEVPLPQPGDDMVL